MSCLKMYMTQPKAKGIPCPPGCTIVKYKGEEDIEAWIDICKDGENSLLNPNDSHEEHVAKFRHEIMELDGPDPMRDTYFVEYEGEKVATITVVPNMWSTGMGYIHMVACKQKCRGMGIGKYMSDFAIQKLVELGKERIFLLSSEGRMTALAVYLKAGFVPADDGKTPEESADQKKRWQYVSDTLGISFDFLNFDGSYNATITPAK